MSGRKGSEKALELLRNLPRINLFNAVPNKGQYKRAHKPRGQHGGNSYGAGRKSQLKHNSYPRIGFEGYNTPFYLKMPRPFYLNNYTGKRQYPPLSLKQLQLMIDTGRIDASQPIDLNTICNTKLYFLEPFDRHAGVHLTDEGADTFTAKVNIEVQHAKEAVIAAVERCGGVITTAFYDFECVLALMNPQKFFERSVPIPLRKLPPEDCLNYYMDPKSRGYLSDPEKIADDRLALAQKFGYELPDLSKDPDLEMLITRKDPRQVFFGLEPGWLVNLADKTILKPTDEVLQEYYQNSL